MPAPPFQCIHQDIAQYPDASENIHATSRWCSRLCRVAMAGRIYNSSATATKKTSISDTAKNIKTLQETENGCLPSYYAH